MLCMCACVRAKSNSALIHVKLNMINYKCAIIYVPFTSNPGYANWR